MFKLGIVIQGGSTNVKEQKECWSEFKNDIIFSTWIGSESQYDLEDNVIYNEYPNDFGPANFNLQIVSTMNGLLKLKELGYTHVLKIRSDLTPTNSKSFLKLIENNDFNFLCWHDHIVYENCPGYLVDYFMSGPIDDMINLWTFEENVSIVPEVNLTWNYICKISNININYVLSDLNDGNNMYWIKNNRYLSTYQKNEIYDKYKKYDFSLNKHFLDKNYLNFLK
jgi:hypothetical protein